MPTRFYLSHHDDTDLAHGVACIRVNELQSDFKYGYYLWKATRWISKVRWPIPE